MENDNEQTGGIHIGVVKQFINTVEAGAMVNFYENEEPVKMPDNYFETEEFEAGVKQVWELVKKGKMVWSSLFYFLIMHGMEETSKNQFGILVNKHGGPSAKTVYSSGDYSFDETQRRNARGMFERAAPYFPSLSK